MSCIKTYCHWHNGARCTLIGNCPQAYEEDIKNQTKWLESFDINAPDNIKLKSLIDNFKNRRLVENAFIQK